MLFFCVAGMGAMRPGSLMIWSFLAMVLCVLSFIFEGGWGGIVSIVLFFVILWIDWWKHAKPSPKALKAEDFPRSPTGPVNLQQRFDNLFPKGPDALKPNPTT